MPTSLNCAHCGGDLGQGDGFCAHCGAACRCGECGASAPPGVPTCPQCHALLDPTLPLAEPGDPDAGASAWTDMVDRLRRATEGEFEIGRELGRGGMAAVFLAHERSLDRQVAIKVMSPGLFLGEGMVERFRHEAITIAHLHHPNIVSVYSVRQAEGLHFFVMRYVQGRSLEQVIHQAGKLPLPVVRSILHQVGSALTYAHRRRVVHRDIKPGNILLDADGNAVVTDFGIAKAAESPSQTMTGALVGTPAYMSPEQCRGAEVSGASDQYALGAVAYEMLTGVPPFSGSTYTVLQAHVERPPLPLRERLADCPPEVEAAVLRMLAKDPAERWPRIADAMAAFGAEPLADDDPLRLELTQLTASAPAAPLSTPPTPPVPATPGGRGSAVAGIAILPPPAGLEVGDSFVLAALVRGPNGTRFPPAAVTWGAEPAGILKLDSGGGPAFAVGAGTTVLTATCKGARATLPIEVSPPRADEIVIDPPEHGIRAGDEIHLEAIARDKRGRLVGRPVAWQTADPGTATVTGAGVLLAQSPGLARITAVLDSVRTNISVPVLPARVAAIHISERPVTATGDAFTLSATPVDRWGSPLPDRTVLWSSSDVRVAVVAAGGRVHALRPGPVVLTASCEGISESLRITVGPAPAEPVAAPAPVPAPGAMLTPAAGSHRRRRRRRSRLEAGLVGAALGAVLFWVFLRPAPAASARVAAEPAGYVAYSGTRGAPGAASVAITRRPDRPLRPKATFQLAAEVRTPDGRPVTGAAVVWSSSDSTVARVDPRSGLIHTNIPGQVQVIAASGGRRDSIPLIVRPFRPRPVGSIAITPMDPLHVGEAATLHAVVRDARGVVLDSAVTWGSSDVSVAPVDPATGRVTGETPGNAVVFARSGGDSTWLELTVLPKAVARVVVHGSPPLLVGQTTTLTAIPTDAAGNAMRDRPVLWSSSDPEVLRVDAGSGIISARSPGSVNVTATSEGTAGTVRITVFARDAALRFE